MTLVSNVKGFVSQESNESPENSLASQQPIQFHCLPESPVSPNSICSDGSPDSQLSLTNLQPAVNQQQKTLRKRNSDDPHSEQQINDTPRKLTRRNGKFSS